MPAPARRRRLALRTGVAAWVVAVAMAARAADEPVPPVDPVEAAAPVETDPNGPSCRLGGEVLQAYGIGSAWADLARMAQDVGAAPLRPDLFQRPGDRGIPLCADGPRLPMGRTAAPVPAGLRLDLVPATLGLYVNTGYPSSANDGLVWQGKGISSQLTAGVQFRWGILSAALVPSVAWQQNAPFPTLPTGLPGNLAYANPYYGPGLDVPQQFGGSNYWTASLGQSYVQLDYAGFGIGVSTENLWWGPGQRSSLLMTNTAPGFPHAYVGTVRPVDVWVGNLEANFWLGQVSRSKYFYTQDAAWFGAFTGDFELRWVRGLYVGVVAVNVSSQLTGGGEDRNSNTLIGGYGRWVFPPAGVEVYGEWTREDAWGSWNDFYKELDHSAGYTLGLQKVFLGKDYWVRLLLEISDNNVPRPSREWRPNPTSYYVHGGNTGYTSGGQILGAAMGPGSSSQYLGADVLAPAGWFGGWLERTRRNDVYYMFGPPQGADGQNDVEIGGGARYLRSFGAFDLGASAGLYKRSAHDGLPVAWNLNAQVQLTWWPDRAIFAGPP
ncbi:MAG: capsule assembly Wzi family protein [Anaeromyxobacteraceae bacterium]